MAAIIVCTNFSPASRNALQYITSIINQKKVASQIELILLHLFEVPVTYSGEGIALTTIPAEIDHAEEQLEVEWSKAKEQFPDLKIKPRLVTGVIQSGLEEQIEEIAPSLVILGAGGTYNDIFSWDEELFMLFRDLTVPVLVIPNGTSDYRLNKIAFACNIQYVNRHTPFSMVKDLIQFSGAELHVLLILTPGPDKIQLNEKEQLVRDQLKDVNPVYHSFPNAGVVDNVGRFIKENNMDLVLVIPRKHGIWETMFRKSQSKDLVRLNTTPVLALREVYNS